MGSKEKLSVTAKGQLRLQLKGRIFLANVTHILTASGPGMHISATGRIELCRY
jgi:hypothetical protein